MEFYTLDPISDGRWDKLAATHAKASAFHQRGWLRALAETYGYRPVVLTTSPPGAELSDGVVFCEVKSWITSRRLVSLPFADHCEPLVGELGGLASISKWVKAECGRAHWRYIELRPLWWSAHAGSVMTPGQSYWLHSIDLTPSLDRLFSGMHKDCMQRRIRRAEREKLTYEKGRSESLLRDFYRLLMITRRRHALLPQPLSWFRNLIRCMGSSLEIRVARKGNVPVAALLSLRHRRTVVYKYGCSDDSLHSLGGMPFLFWKLIEESKAENAELLDLGRTDLDHGGLIEFKERMGATRRMLTYLRYPETESGKSLIASYLPVTRSLFSVLPDALSSRMGSLLYRHFG